MEKKRKYDDLLLPSISLILDIIAIEAAFLFSYWLRFHTDFLMIFRVGEEIPPFSTYFVTSLFIIPIWLLILHSYKMYTPHRTALPSEDFITIIKAVTLGLLIIIGIAFFYREVSYSRFVVVSLWISGILFLVIDRLIVYLIQKKLYKKGKQLKEAVIFGSNDSADLLFKKILSTKLLGYKLSGYYSDNRNENYLNGLHYLGTIDDLIQSINCGKHKTIFISLEPEEHSKLYYLLDKVEGINVEMMLIPNVLDLMTSSLKVKELDGIPLLKLKGISITTWGRILKRSFDIIFSLLILLITLPIFIVIALLIKFTSKGPIIYKQERVGLDGKTFTVYKFRTMYVDAEKNTGPVWAKKDDPRTTKIGRILRRTSLDELPQFINVLKSDMSVVGPRPERPYFVEQFKDVVPKYLDRHLLKTGITGWAQVNGLRGQAPIKERTKYDLYYIENWSMAFDIKIILKTLKAILFGKDAY
ncbi:MAG: Bacterial sugar transferase [Ignavibacteriae bacterium]|nr:MAG: Bacterial sugar transferase [Ignavibacteriota bacterium]